MRDPAAPPLRLATDSWLGGGHGVAVQEHRLRAGVALHWHEFFELSFVVEGTGVHTVNGVPQPVRPGDVLVLSPADFHELGPDAGGGLRVTNVVYTDEWLPADLRAAMPPIPTLHMPELDVDFARLVREHGEPGPIAALAMRATLTRVLADLARTMATAAPRRPRARRDDLHRALSWVDHHFRERIRLADAAAVACLSPHHFSGLFRRHTGVSFQDYLMNRRLQFARGLLAAADLPVTEVCHAAGFNDLTHFSRSYRRRYGHPPSHGR